jgi:uncharacterized protein (TIGR02001 family)
MNRKTTTASALAMAGLMAATPSFAEDSPHSLTANVGIYSQYVFRGITQTAEDPALQGGFDYAHSSGIYLGVWGSNISWLNDANAYTKGGSLEMDFYGGYKGTIGDFGYDLGVLQYWYPGDAADGFNKADTTELYVAGSWKWFTVKYSYAVSNKVFGYSDADGSDYWDFGASVPIGESGFTLGAHYGIQGFKGSTAGVDNSNYEYDDWKVSATYDMGKLSKTLGGVTVGIAYTDTNADSAYWTVNGNNLGDSQFLGWVSKSF